MDQENNIDELDKMLFNYFDSNKDVPNYINETIHNTLQKEKKQRNSFNIMKKVAMIIISFGIISTSIFLQMISLILLPQYLLILLKQ